MQRNGKAFTIYMVSMCSSMAGVTAMAAIGVANTLSKAINVTSSLRNSLEQTTLLRHWKVRVRAISICIIAQAHVVSKSLHDALIAMLLLTAHTRHAMMPGHKLATTWPQCTYYSQARQACRSRMSVEASSRVARTLYTRVSTLADLSMSFQAAAAGKKGPIGKHLVLDVMLSLEEVASGCLKQVAYQRKRICDGEMLMEEREVTIEFKPGMMDGTTFVFEGCGSSWRHAIAARCGTDATTCTSTHQSEQHSSV
jgi:DnaJ C terminal domain